LATPTALDNALATIAAVPAWPVVLLIVIVAGVVFAWRKGRNAAVRASRAW
jgi:cbb3-type cytochrome oxidase subunit 3